MELRFNDIEVVLPGKDTPLFTVPKFTIPAGQKLLIYGPSGKGKTTLLHLMAGLFLPHQGYVYVDGENIRFLSDHARSHLRRKFFGIVFQRLNLIDHLNALENVLLALDPAASSVPFAKTALEQLGMGTMLHERVANLSLGEQQRVAVARVTAKQPRIILCDEPTSSLDAANANRVMDAILEVPGNPTTVVVSHDERIRNRFPHNLNFDELGRQ